MDLLEEQIRKSPAERFESLVRVVKLLQQINPRIAEENISAEDHSHLPPERAV